MTLQSAALRMGAQVGGAALALGLLAAPFAAHAAADLSGMWWVKDRSQKAHVDAAGLPLTPEAAAQFKANQAAVAAGKPVPPGQVSCLPEGMPRLMLARYPVQILQRPEQVTFLHERQHMVRFLYMDGKVFDPDMDPTYNGFSTAKWDGDALLVETQGFKANTVIDDTGIPHSDAMKIHERFTLQDGGKTLRDEVTIEDPKAYSKPWSFSIDFEKQTGVRLMEDVCTFGPPQRDRVKP